MSKLAKVIHVEFELTGTFVIYGPVDILLGPKFELFNAGSFFAQTNEKKSLSSISI